MAVAKLIRTHRFINMSEELEVPAASSSSAPDSLPPSDNDDIMAEYLKSWGLEMYIQKFREQYIDVDVLQMLSQEDIQELVPIIGHRVKLTAQVSMLKNIVAKAFTVDTAAVEDNYNTDINTAAVTNQGGVQYYTIVNAVEEPQATHQGSPAFGQEPVEPKDNSHSKLYEILSSCNEGKGLLLQYQQKGLLKNASRRRLCQIIINHELKDDPDKKLTSSRFYQLAYEISKIFVKENPAVYFTPFASYGPQERTTAKGKLLDCYRQRRRDFLKNGLIKAREKRCDSLAEQQQSQAEQGEDTAEKLLWLKESCDPWETVEENWNETCKSRMNLLKSENLTIHQYYAQFKALNQQKGLFLMLQDYKRLYPNNDQTLKENWLLVRPKIIEHAKKGSTAYIRDMMKSVENEHSEEVLNLAAFLAIPFLMGTLTTRKKEKEERQSRQKENSKSMWRPSKQETLESFITHVKSAADIGASLARRQDKLAGLGLTMQPFVVIVGPTIKDISARYIVVDKVHYEATSVVDAIDACFKIMFVLNAQYPAECAHVWQFVQVALFKLKTKSEKIYTSVNALITDLNIQI